MPVKLVAQMIPCSGHAACPHCGGPLRVIACCIDDSALIAKILGHIRRRKKLNPPLAQAPPRHWEQTFDLI